jgi:chlorite dismutase
VHAVLLHFFCHTAPNASFAIFFVCRDKHALREALGQATADADSRAHKCDQLSAALRSLERERELQQQKALEEREQLIAAADMRLLQTRADLEDTQEREAQLRREVAALIVRW